MHRSHLATLCASLVLFAGAPAAAAAQTNLLQNPAARVGAVSVQGWDAVTIPGWQVASGLPTVVADGTPGFPAGGAGSRRMFAGGAGGSARLVQDVDLRTRTGAPVSAGTPYVRTARLGAGATSTASVDVVFESASGASVGERVLGPVAGHQPDATQLTTRAV